MNYIIIGCGRVFEYYRKNVFPILPPYWNLIGLIENSPEKISYLKNEFDNIPIFFSINDLLTSEKRKIDIGMVLSISGLHFNHAKSLLENNINVIIEKPISMIPSEIKELNQIAIKKKKRIFSVFQNRYNKAIVLVKKLINENKLGEIRTSRVSLRWCRNESYFSDSWRGTWKYDGGVLNNQAIHHLDAYQWLMGMPKELFTINKTNHQKIEAEDTSLSVFSFKNGSLGSFEATTLAPKKDMETCMDIIGSKGYIKLGGLSLNKVLDTDLKNKKYLIENHSEDFNTGYGNGHIKLFKEIISCFEDDKEYSIKISSVLKTSELINAMYLSANTGKRVSTYKELNYVKLGLCE